ncbi:hypothetical protein HAP94_13125 [Acidithiobacillus ferrivorans]|nr:hypothetical protein [Acidithiobacillus ferrivorans]
MSDTETKIDHLPAFSSDLTAMVKYLAYVPLATFNPDDLKNAEIRERMQHYRNEKPEIWRRACQLAQAIQTRVIGTVKKIRFATGTHRRDPKQSRSQVIHDPSNAEYQWWYKLRMGSGRAKKTFIYLPLTFNPKYMKPEDLRLDAVHVCYVRHGRQFMVGATYEGEPPKFREPWVKSHGIDVNTRTNLLPIAVTHARIRPRSSSGETNQSPNRMVSVFSLRTVPVRLAITGVANSVMGCVLRHPCG